MLSLIELLDTASPDTIQDMGNDNFNMYDLIAYRIKFTAHPHAGDKWCIYPSYDYTHCINDSLENVTHSLCTLEFESRRASYYWLLQSLDLYMPVVWEYSRLNITHNMLSKRKLNKLCTGGYVRGWDDPRLLTLAGLRRRGAPPEAINNFVKSIGVSRNENLISIQVLDHHIRDTLNRTAPRNLAVLHPLRVVITNYPEGQVEEVTATTFPQRPGDAATYKLPFQRVVFIERSDFREKDEKDYYGLAPGKSVILRYAYPITCKEAVRNDAGEVVELRCEYDKEKTIKPKGVIHWVTGAKAGVVRSGEGPPLLLGRCRSHLPLESLCSPIFSPASLFISCGTRSTLVCARTITLSAPQPVRLGSLTVCGVRAVSSPPHPPAAAADDGGASVRPSLHVGGPERHQGRLARGHEP